MHDIYLYEMGYDYIFINSEAYTIIKYVFVLKINKKSTA